MGAINESLRVLLESVLYDSSATLPDFWGELDGISYVTLSNVFDLLRKASIRIREEAGTKLLLSTPEDPMCKFEAAVAEKKGLFDAFLVVVCVCEIFVLGLQMNDFYTETQRTDVDPCLPALALKLLGLDLVPLLVGVMA